MLTVNFITNKFFNSRTYILSKEGCDCVWLVDCGDPDVILDMIGEKTVEGVLLTHAHSDHIYGLEQLLIKFPEVRIYTNAIGVEELRSPKLNLSHYHSEYPDILVDEPYNVFVLEEGSELNVLGESCKVLETPGHAPSCLTYLIEDNAFTGDAYIPGVKVFTGFPHADRKQASASVERIKELIPNYHIMPGHTMIEGDTSPYTGLDEKGKI